MNGVEKARVKKRQKEDVKRAESGETERVVQKLTSTKE